MSSLGKKLKHLRERSCLKQEDIAQFLNVSRGTISKYESDDREPDINTVKALAKFYNVPLDYIFGLADFEYPLEDNYNSSPFIKDLSSKEYGSQKQNLIELDDDLLQLVKKIMDNKLDIRAIENIIDNIIALNKSQKCP